MFFYSFFRCEVIFGYVIRLLLIFLKNILVNLTAFLIFTPDYQLIIQFCILNIDFVCKSRCKNELSEYSPSNLIVKLFWL